MNASTALMLLAILALANADLNLEEEFSAAGCAAADKKIDTYLDTDGCEKDIFGHRIFYRKRLLLGHKLLVDLLLRRQVHHSGFILRHLGCRSLHQGYKHGGLD
ncbi:unnamed protein product [Polarella glacialis]|uniref:Uncharacterized protein n=1 Tax=Polarella glacialis TaxID=89957 RepID=A0A813JCP7_POLGL|nr:unnamed protein product [Polarella glacialis]CAE8676501.1 unnamed protein product [Polarella glacialis]